MPDYIIRKRDRGQAEAKCLPNVWPGRGQSFKAEAKSVRLRPKFWPRGHFSLEDLTSLNLRSAVDHDAQAADHLLISH